MATRADLEAGFAAMDARFAVLEERLDGMDRRSGVMERHVDDRFDVMQRHVVGRLDVMEHGFKEHVSSEYNRLDANFERRMTQAITMQTRTLVWSQLGALVTVAALAFGLR